MNSHDTEYDDLTVIKGIGPARQQWLRETLDVRTYQDLASLSVDEVENLLKAEGQAVPRSDLNRWIAEAQDLAATVTPSTQQITEPEVADAEATANSAFVEGEWKPYASFVVEFQTLQAAGQTVERRTKVHYMEGDKSETWPDVERERLCQWMLDQVENGLPRELKKEEVATEQPPAAEIEPAAAQPVARVEEPATTVEEVEEQQVEVQVAEVEPVPLTVSQLRVFQPPQMGIPTATGETGRPFLGYVRGNQSFALEAPFELAGPAAVEAANKQRAYQVQFYAYKLATGATIHLGDTQQGVLVKDRLSYIAQLPEASLPPGTYRLRALAVVQATPPITAFLEVPLLQVA